MPVIILTSDQPYNLKSLATQGSLPPGIPVDFGPVVFKAHVAGQKTLAERLDARLILDTHAEPLHTDRATAACDQFDPVRG